MQLGNDIRNDIKTAKKVWLPWWGVLCWMIACALIVWPFYHSKRLDLALPTLNSIGVVGFVIAIKWKLRRNGWFWITMTIIAALHILLILLVPWTMKWFPAIAIAAIDSADFCVILGIIAVVEKLVGASTAFER